MKVSNMKPIKIYWTPGASNPSQIAFILEEIAIPYHDELIKLKDIKAKDFPDNGNPNETSPAIYDPNTNLTLWESNAIISYLIEVYDNHHKISYAGFPEKSQTLAWQHFLALGHGPYFGAHAWLWTYPIQAAESLKVRHFNEMKRIVGVLDKQLSKSKYLVGDKCTYSDLSYITWNIDILFFMGSKPSEGFSAEAFPNFKRWHDSLMERESVSRVFEMQEESPIDESDSDE